MGTHVLHEQAFPCKGPTKVRRLRRWVRGNRRVVAISAKLVQGFKKRLNNETSLLVVLIVRKATQQVSELEALYRQRFSAFARVAISMTRSVELGREAVQEAFARAIEQVDGFRGDCPLEAWVWRIVVNTARTSARRAAYEDADATINPEPEGTNGHTDLPAVQLWVRALPERQRAVVFLRYWADLDYRSIADALEIEVGTVSATLNAAHSSLRRLLQEEIPK